MTPRILAACALFAFSLAAQEAALDANGWEQRGMAQMKDGQYKNAAVSFQKALDQGYPPAGRYNLACALARLGEKDRAIEILTAMTNNGAVIPIATDADLESLHGDPRFEKLVESARAAAEPCKHPDRFPEYRRLDFWIGNWDVFDPSGKKVGESHVDLILKDCVIFENWTGTAGGSGKSFNMYNSASHKWEQFWVADSGNTNHFIGEATDSEMRYVFERQLPDGRTLTRHMNFTKLPAGKVRQFSERSLDGGKTWYTEYDFTYVPKKS